MDKIKKELARFIKTCNYQNKENKKVKKTLAIIFIKLKSVTYKRIK